MLPRRLMVLAFMLIAMPALAQLRWREGEQYQLLPTVQRAGAPADKIEVAEVFSYGCPYCYQAKDVMAKLATELPPDAAMFYVHASFQNESEAWPMFQRAYYTAQKLGIALGTHDAMFKAIWETGEMPLVDKATGKLLQRRPTIEDAAKFHARLGKVKAADFLSVAKSPEIDVQMQRADALIKLWRIPGTPALVVNGRYLIDNRLAHAEQAQIAKFLIGLERTRLEK